ncbi:MAG: hypothetical protein A4S09_10850 [Proteobacteria bacterium SG_bin7]|nr:MAG: hypothetical protein A4S09_10850 [Proteobacteria bacterium SG_bin7]
MIERILNHQIANNKKSLLLLGPRQIGKTTLLRNFKSDLTINLAREREYQDHLSSPSLIEDLVERSKARTVFVDEIQRLPSMLNTIQALIDEKRLRFFITGSSARKLKRGQANLLPGRVINKRLFPLTVNELGYDIDAQDAIQWGFLPGIVTTEDKDIRQDILSSYVSNYLKEEIQQEALTRNIAGYSRFLQALPEWNGKVLDYSKLATKNKLNRFAVHRFFEIFEDTLLGERIFSSEHFKEVPSVKHPKFYFFDVGVMNGILNIFKPSGDYLGAVCETIIFNQLNAALAYKNKRYDIKYFRTHSGIEVDFILTLENKIFAIEVKANERLGVDDVKGLRYVRKLDSKVVPYLLHFGKRTFKIENIWCMNWLEGLREIGL